MELHPFLSPKRIKLPRRKVYKVYILLLRSQKKIGKTSHTSKEPPIQRYPHSESSKIDVQHVLFGTFFFSWIYPYLSRPSRVSEVLPGGFLDGFPPLCWWIFWPPPRTLFRFRYFFLWNRKGRSFFSGFFKRSSGDWFINMVHFSIAIEGFARMCINIPI